jgi:hypothetical protein
MKSAFHAMLFATMCALAAPAHAQSGGTNTPSSATTVTAPAPQLPRGTELGSRAEDRRYASREAASPEAKQFRGGDAVVISTTAVAIILLVIVIIILL